MAYLFLAIGVICNSISVVLLQIQIRRFRREVGRKLFDFDTAKDWSYRSPGCYDLED